MTDKKQLLHNFVCDVIDVRSPTVFNTFIENDKINSNKLMSHSLLKCNVMFCQVWFSCFGNYPTKVDFEDFVNILGGIDNLLINRNANISVQSIAYGVSKHEAFLVFQITSTAQQILTEVWKRLNAQSLSTDLINDVLVKKWLHRYDSHVSFQSSDNILQKYVKIYLDYQQRATKTSVPNQVPLRFIPETPTLSDTNLLTTLSSHELVQYIIHKNNRFLLHMHTAFFIISQVADVPNVIIESIENTFNTRCFVIYIDVEPCVSNENMENIYTLTRQQFKLLPKIFQNVCCIDTDELVDHYISSTSKTSIYIHLGRTPIKPVANVKFVLSHDIQQANPLQNTFYLPCNVDQDTTKYLLSHYLKLKSPFKTMNMDDNAILYNHFIANYISLNMNNIAKSCPLQTQSSKYVICSVDSRFNIATYYAVLLSYYNITKHDAHWDMVIVTKDENCQKYKEYHEQHGRGMGSLSCVSLPKLNNTKQFSIETYNSILKDEEFWQVFQNNGYEKCLIVQDDGFLINGTHLEEYMDYAYVGAPWADVIGNAYIKNNINPELVGNGGFSLRDINIMANICKNYKQEKNKLFFNNLNEIPEDVYFVKCLSLSQKSIAPRKVAQHFSIEQVIPDTGVKDIVGFHKFWMYHSPATVWSTFKVLIDSI